MVAFTPAAPAHCSLGLSPLKPLRWMLLADVKVLLLASPAGIHARNRVCRSCHTQWSLFAGTALHALRKRFTQLY
jgi:hypothetical protein